MAGEQVNPFEVKAQPSWGGMPQITPQGGEQPEGGSYFSLSPEAMQMMWAPQAQVPIPQPQVQAQPQQVNPYA